MVSGGWGARSGCRAPSFCFSPSSCKYINANGLRAPPARKSLTPNDLCIEKKLKKNLTRQSKRCILVLL
jgi:hypothetical protein